MWINRHFRCVDCHSEWAEEWSDYRKESCPACRCETQPYDAEELTVLGPRPVRFVRAVNGAEWTEGCSADETDAWEVRISPLAAEEAPDYHIFHFALKNGAEGLVREAWIAHRQGLCPATRAVELVS